ANARKKLANNPEKLAKFEELYEAARRYIIVTEDHSYWIDSMSIAAMRQLALACGRRLVQKGVIGDPDDVFYLRLQELKDNLGGNTADRRQIARQRRDEKAEWSRAVPPLSIGVPPPESDDPFVDSLLVRFLGPFMEPEREPDLIKGIAAAPGMVQGVAKVVRSLNEASKLREGDIMVCEMTLPPWTPLFSNIGGVVADTGGVLSHCAIVSREYHIPAVVGTVIGTTTIKDGMTITVDGTKGLVRIDARP
ncbi:MAG TPA: PEP-utilizing enzyme, partial [Chloroflexota bacterium]|nr:PEP-utilizing enzyme [Chloroflexota bacterium]